MTRCLIIAGTQSSVGKTTITVGLLAALRRRGLCVQPFKVGPDYIDPTYHRLAAGRTCRNLDTWMMTPERMCALFEHAAHDADLAIVEGVMGLFDGFDYEGEVGSTAQVAKLLCAPVVLVLDASKLARSAAAIAAGFQRFDPELPLAGFIINRVGSAGHGEGVAAAVTGATGLPVFGWLPRSEPLQIPERHLGLIPTLELGSWQDFSDAAAACVTRHLDLDRLMACAQEVQIEAPSPKLVGTLRAPSHRPVIAVARDEAFHFTYEENLELLRAAGAEVVFFSPLKDAGLPPEAAGIVLSGGFPEVFADKLAANTAMLAAIRQAHQRRAIIYAECGGLMYLTRSIVDSAGREHPLVGLLPGRSVMTGKLTLGYREARAATSSWLLQEGETLRGHEFHYSTWEGRPGDLPPAYLLTHPRGKEPPRPEGACLGNLWASYVHLHFWSKSELADRFVFACSRV